MQTHNYSFILNRDKGCYSWVPFFTFPIDAMFVIVKNIPYNVTSQQKNSYHVKTISEDTNQIEQSEKPNVTSLVELKVVEGCWVWVQIPKGVQHH